MKKSLRSFNPTRVAQLELEMWKAYYHHKFLKLFLLLLQLTKEFFGFSYLKAIRPAYYASIAAAHFRLNKGKETQEVEEKILKNLTKLYKIIKSNCSDNFDYEKMAQLELEWWLIDRYPNRYETTREQALAAAMATLMSVESLVLSDYASNRAEAMVLCDKIEGKDDQKVDWERVGILLINSYRSLSKAVQ